MKNQSMLHLKTVQIIYYPKPAPPALHTTSSKEMYCIGRLEKTLPEIVLHLESKRSLNSNSPLPTVATAHLSVLISYCISYCR